MKIKPLKTAAGCAVLLSLFVATSLAAETRSVGNSIPSDVARLHLKDLGRLPATNQLRLAIQLPLHNQATLTTFLQQIYQPGNANFHHYLTPEQFTDRFGPTAQEYDTVIGFAKAAGLEVTTTRSSRMVLDVKGKVSDIERAFQIHMRTYQHPTENRQFYAPDVEPSVDASLPISDINGLSDYARPISLLHKTNKKTNVVPAGGSAPQGHFMGSDFRNAYVPGVTLDGTGQMVGLFEFDAFYTNDILAYERQADLPNVPLITVSIDNFTNSPGSGNPEVALDIEDAIAMAPGLAAVVVFEGSSMVDILDSMASSNQIKQFSSSWVIGSSGYTNGDAAFQKIAAQGQSYFQASGDADAWFSPILTPCDNPSPLSVERC